MQLGRPASADGCTEMRNGDSPQLHSPALKIVVHSHRDIGRIYQRWKSSPGWGYFESSQDLWSAAKQHASSICEQILKEWHDNPGSVNSYNQIVRNIGWKTYSPKLIIKSTASTKTGVETKRLLEFLLSELTSTTHAIDDLRMNCIVDHWFDPAESTSVMLSQTSDSCDTEDDCDTIYVQMRERLTEFHNDKNRKHLTTKPIVNPRLRKDIRAWARLARYQCIKLPCKSMLIHKDRGHLPRKLRRKQNGDRQPPVAFDKPFWNQLKSIVDTKLEVNKNICSYKYGKVYPGPNHYPGPDLYPDPDLNDSIWDYRNSRGGYSSAGSNLTSASGKSGVSSSKSRRLPRDEDGYACDFPGCESIYNRQCDLRQHKRCHRSEEELPHVCETCNKRFPYAKDLRRHLKVHEKH